MIEFLKGQPDLPGYLRSIGLEEADPLLPPDVMKQLG